MLCCHSNLILRNVVGVSYHIRYSTRRNSISMLSCEIFFIFEASIVINLIPLISFKKEPRSFPKRSCLSIEMHTAHPSSSFKCVEKTLPFQSRIATIQTLIIFGCTVCLSFALLINTFFLFTFFVPDCASLRTGDVFAAAIPAHAVPMQYNFFRRIHSWSFCFFIIHTNLLWPLQCTVHKL